MKSVFKNNVVKVSAALQSENQDSAIAYEKNARQFLCKRDGSNIGSEVVRGWAHKLPKNAKVLELACGGGYPITKTLVEAGVKLWAEDSSKTLIETFQSRFPSVAMKCERVQESQFFNRKFDAAIAIGLLFLLPEPEQMALIKKISNFLIPGGRFLFTSPIETGAWQDMNTGIQCYSLGYKKYKEALEKSGFRIIANFYDEGKNNYYETEIVNLNERCA